MKKYQKGFINIPTGAIETLFILAIFGLISAICGLFYLIYWLFTHVQLTIV